jgi:sulfite reductase alpha subunit-like flavoprotein
MYGRPLSIPELVWNFARSNEPINSDFLPRIPKTDIVLTKAMGVIEPGIRGLMTTVNSKVLLTHPSAVKPVHRFTLKSSKLADWNYEPGDSFDCFCENDPEQVEELLALLNIQQDELIHITNHPSQVLNSSSLSVKKVLSKYLDISQFPKKAFLRHLAEYCEDLVEKRCLLYLSSRLGSPVYLELTKQYACLLDFLVTFRSCKPTIECLFANLPALFPRSYSLTCSRLDGECEEIEFIASIDHYQTPEPNQRLRVGICSKYFQDHVKEGSLLEIAPRKSTDFHLPQDHNKNLLLICAGAGIAPFISFLRHRRAMKCISDCWLFYGLRSREQDFLFQDELSEFLTAGVLSKLFTATSRDEPKRYVQDVMWEQRGDLFEYICDPNTIVYLCGDEMTMIKGVNDAITNILSERLGLDQATGLVKKWTVDKKILKDIWL